MDPEYQLDAGTAALVANLTAVVSGIVASTPSSLVTTTSLSDVSSPADVAILPSSAPPATISPAVVEHIAVTEPPAITSVTSSAGGLGSFSLKDQLQQMQDAIQKLHQPPTIVVVNQPSPPAPTNWYQDVDGAAAGSLAAIVMLLVVVAACLLLRRFRPQMWEAAKGVAIRVLQWVALPVSWAFSKAAEALRHFHNTNLKSPEVVPQTTGMQVCRCFVTLQACFPQIFTR